jgi:hypothetical protein
MSLRQAPRGAGLKGRSLRRDDTPQERTTGDAILELIRASPDGLTNSDLAAALGLEKPMVVDVTWRLWMGGKVRTVSSRPGVPVRYVPMSCVVRRTA